ncbi:MAG: hypothetical protein H7A49_11910 [Akkermansiaceae bacterium]|nr:hypothetical protein [Akkermansiaceae bacterium]
MKTLVLRLLCFIATYSAVHAADVRILAWDEEVAARKLTWVHAKDSREISDLHPLRRSDPYPGPSKGAQVVIRADDRTPQEGEAAVELRCSVNPSFRRPLLILLPDTKAATGLRGLVIDENLTSFGWGTMRFLNATGEEVVVQIDQKALRVPGGWKPVDFRPGGKRRNVGIRIALSKTIETPAYTSVWEHRDDGRSLVFILRGGDPRLGSLALKALPEIKGEDATLTTAE